MTTVNAFPLNNFYLHDLQGPLLEAVATGDARKIEIMTHAVIVEAEKYGLSGDFTAEDVVIAAEDMLQTREAHRKQQSAGGYEDGPPSSFDENAPPDEPGVSGKAQGSRDKGDDLQRRVSHLPVGWHLVRPPPHPMVLHPYIPLGKVSALLGAGTSSKTLLVCEWAAAIAVGSDWRGHRTIEGDVVIVTWEDEREDYHAKLHSLVNARSDLLPFTDLIAERVHFIELHGSLYRLVDCNA